MQRLCCRRQDCESDTSLRSIKGTNCLHNLFLGVESDSETPGNTMEIGEAVSQHGVSFHLCRERIPMAVALASFPHRHREAHDYALSQGVAYADKHKLSPHQWNALLV